MLLIFVVIAVSWPATPVRSAEIAVIGHRAFPVDTIELEHLREVYRGERRYVKGVPVYPADHRDTDPLKRLFIKQIVGQSLNTYKGNWLMLVFKESKLPPPAKTSHAEMLNFVSTQVGGIGYIWSDEIGNSRVKVLATIPVQE